MLNRLSQRVDILVKDSTQDASGGLSNPPKLLYGNLWASVEDLTGKQTFTADQLIPEVVIRVIVRKRSAISSACLVRWNSQVYTIAYTRDPASERIFQPFAENITNTPGLLRNMYTELMCYRVSDQSPAVAALQQAHAVPDHD